MSKLILSSIVSVLALMAAGVFLSGKRRGVHPIGPPSAKDIHVDLPPMAR